ncbi:hypothetical protein M3Y98_01102700 [Aphelenchoides besseyi]|nr:hypothetical protein M3Y98_01102700 [Aphelenchoides besseyi]
MNLEQANCDQITAIRFHCPIRSWPSTGIQKWRRKCECGNRPWWQDRLDAAILEAKETWLFDDTRRIFVRDQTCVVKTEMPKNERCVRFDSDRDVTAIYTRFPFLLQINESESWMTENENGGRVRVKNDRTF